MLVCDTDIAILSVRPSAWYCIFLVRKCLTYHHTFFSIWQANRCSFPSYKHLCEIPTGSHPPPPGAGCWIQVGYRNFMIFSQISHTFGCHNQGCYECFLPRKKYRPWKTTSPHEIQGCGSGHHHRCPISLFLWKIPQWKTIPPMKFMLVAATVTTGVS